MPDHTPHQKKIIERYYDNRDAIMLERISELVTELYLADSDKKKDRLWERVATAMSHLKIRDTIAANILKRRDPQVLAANLKDWLQQAQSR